MLSRRDFLGGLIASVAAAALFKNGVTQPEQAIAEPKRTVFDMAANTWREQRVSVKIEGLSDLKQALDGFPPLRPRWPLSEIKVDWKEVDEPFRYSFSRDAAGEIYQRLRERGVIGKEPFCRLDNFGISCDVAAKRIQAFCQAVLEDDARRAIDATPT